MKALGEVAEAIAKAGVPVAVFGYMALRAHLNRIGIPSTATLGLERYLAETFLLVTSLLLPIGIVVASLSVLVVASRVIWRFLAIKGLAGPFVSVPEPQRGWPLVFVLLAAYLLLISRIATAWPQMDIAVGDLAADSLDGPSGWPTLLWLVFVSIGGAAALRIGKPDATTAVTLGDRTLAQQLSITMLIVLTAHVPLVFGWAVRPAQYPAVRVDLKEPAESLCGLLVIETDADIRVWRGANQRGEIVRVPRTRAVRIVAGPVHDLVDDARRAVAGGSAPACP